MSTQNQAATAPQPTATEQRITNSVPAASEQQPQGQAQPDVLLDLDTILANTSNDKLPATCDMLAWARMMARHSFLPQHLRWASDPVRTEANCFRVVAQARQWKLDPFTVGENSSLIAGRLVYSGVIVAAVIHNSGKLAGRLSFTTTGQGDGMVGTVSGTLKGGKQPLQHSLCVRQVRTTSKAWDTDTLNMLWYRCVRAWAKLFVPEVLIGCGDDELTAETGVDTAQAVDPTPGGSLASAETINEILRVNREKGGKDAWLRRAVRKFHNGLELHMLTQAQAERVLADLMPAAPTSSTEPAQPIIPQAGTPSGAVPPMGTVPAQPGDESKTLQQALADDAATQAALRTGQVAQGLATPDQLARVVAVRESWWSLLGIPDPVANNMARADTWAKVLAKRGVQFANRLPAAECEKLIESLERAVAAMVEDRRNSGVTCAEKTPPASVPPANPKT